MLARLIAALLAATCVEPAFAESAAGRSVQILERLNHANGWRDHVMVVGHRGGVRENGRVIRPENSISAIEAAIAMGLEMVELDVQKTRDGVFVVLHDTWLDRTTSCAGELIERNLAELSECRLRVGDFGPVTNEGVPTLREALQAARGKVLVNIDNKLGSDALPEMIAISREFGMAGQVIVKQNLWNDGRISAARGLLDTLGGGARFMPILADDAVGDPHFIEEAARAVQADAVELVAWRREAGPMTPDGGALFSMRARAVAARGDWHLWVNTYSIVNKPAGYLSGGRGDEMATIAGNPDDVFGFWVERGVTIIQTDEPRAALDWLAANGWRRPYEQDAIVADTAAALN